MKNQAASQDEQEETKQVLGQGQDAERVLDQIEADDNAKVIMNNAAIAADGSRNAVKEEAHNMGDHVNDLLGANSSAKGKKPKKKGTKNCITFWSHHVEY